MDPLFRSQPKRWPLLLAVICCLVALAIGIGIGLVIGRGSKGSEKVDSPTVEKYVDVREQLMSNIKPENILDNLRFMSSKPHIAGSDRQLELANWVQQKWEEFGADHVTKTPYNVLLSYPDRNNPNKVSILDDSGTVLFETAGFEKKLSPDQNHSDVIPPFNAFAPAGDVQGQLVYANYGRASDFEMLQRMGVNCSGKIVIARYGKIYRGNKLNEAAKNGALGLIIYTDPELHVGDDKSNVFPNTWWLPGTGIQRGSTSLVKGDQLTQGYPAKDYAYRIPMNEYKEHIQLPIPCQPIGYDEAQELLRRLGGAEVPMSWQGGLNFTYRLGPGFSGLDSARTVRIQVHNTEVMKTIYNVVGRIVGTVEPDRYVIIGSHRDAWMFGSVDALSSQAGMIEVVRAFGELKKAGWQPRRTLIFISWDAEEYGMVGSYEWVEENWKTLQDRAVAYLNGDTTLTGNFTLKGYSSPILRDTLMDSTKQVQDPHQPSESLYDTWRMRDPERPNMPDSKPRIRVPGSGTDYAHFLYFAGVPITYHKFQPDPSIASGYPLYHTVYETFQLVKLMDPEAKVMTAAAQVWAKLAHTLIDSELLPFNVSRVPEIISQYVTIAKERYGETFSSQGIPFDALESAAENLTWATERFEETLSKLDRKNPLDVRQVNDKMMKLERTFLDPAGQPGRPMFKHVVFSPSSKNNYAGSVFSGLGDLLYDIERTNNTSTLWVKVKKHFAVIIHTIQAAADFMKDP